MEVAALNMGLSWALRSTKRHDTRLVLLVDSKVAIGGAAKGRSSSKALLRELRRTAALTLAGSLQVHYVYIHTKENPADVLTKAMSVNDFKAKMVSVGLRLDNPRIPWSSSVRSAWSELSDCG